jgi:uncharacterized protein
MPTDGLGWPTIRHLIVFSFNLMTDFAAARLLIALVSTAWLAPASAIPVPQNVVANLLAHAELVRQGSVPAPPAGVQDLQWQQLYPASWKPGKILDQLGVGKLQDDDPQAPSIMTRISRAWQAAPVMEKPIDGPVRLTGFAVMPKAATDASDTVILVPYYGACIHTPPPPPNQMVRVKFKQKIPTSMYQFPIWVTGKLQVKSSATEHGRVAYQIDNATWEPYPYLKYPMPKYQLLR